MWCLPANFLSGPITWITTQIAIVQLLLLEVSPTRTTCTAGACGGRDRSGRVARIPLVRHCCRESTKAATEHPRACNTCMRVRASWSLLSHGGGADTCADTCAGLQTYHIRDVLRAKRSGQSISNSNIKPLVVKMACKQNLDLRCVLISDPSTLGAGAKTRLHTPKAVTYHEQPHCCRFMIGHSLGRMESRIKKFTPHCVCRPHGHRLSERRPRPRRHGVKG